MTAMDSINRFTSVLPSITIPRITTIVLRIIGKRGGTASTFFFIDQEQDVTAVCATQQFLFNFPLNIEFHHIVLESLAQEEAKQSSE
jgi:hypothetical protein